MPIAHVIPEIIVGIGAIGVLFLSMVLGKSRQAMAAPVAILVLLTAGIHAGWLHMNSPQTLSFSGTWALDSATAWGRYSILFSTLLAVILSPRWFANDNRHGEWYVTLLFAGLGAILMAGAADLMELIVAVLMSSASGYVLASFHRQNRMCAEAGAKFYFLGALANPLLFLGCVFLYGLTAATRYGEIQLALNTQPLDAVYLSVAVGLILIGLAFKLGAFPVHPWVPDVSQGSPAPAAAFLTVAPKLGALLATARFVHLLPDGALAWRPALAVMAAMTMTVGNLAALWQQDVRRLLGWSSVSQAGYGLMAVVAIDRAALALPSLVLFLLAYATANMTAFAVVVSLRGRTQLSHYHGLGRTHFAHAAALALALLSLFGIPPLAGFIAKLMLFGAAIEAGYSWLAAVAVINTVVSFFYYFRVIGPMFLSEADVEIKLLGGQAGRTAFVGSGLVILLGLGSHFILAGAAKIVLLP